MRFQIRIDPIWRAPLLLGGATRENSHVELTDAGVRFRFGLLFDRLVPYDEIKTVFARSWPFLYGIGWRSNLRGVIGLVGSYHDVVEVRLKRRLARVWGVFPVDRIGVSLEEPERFIYELEQRLAPPAPEHASRGSRATTTRKRTRKREA
jgi:hypothetical protein